MLVKPSYKEGWLLPGGGAVSDEMPHVAARREAAEGTGLSDLVPGDLLITDYVRANSANGAVEGVNFVFDGGVIPEGSVITLPAAKLGQELPS